MNMRTKIKKSIVAIIICSNFAVLRPAQAFILPITDIPAVGGFINEVANAITEVKNAKSQIKSAIDTVSAVGDQVTAITKFTADLKNSVAKLGNIDLSVINVERKVKEKTDDANEAAEQTQASNEELVEALVEDINSQLEDGATEEEINETIEDAKGEAQASIEELNQKFDEAKTEISNLADETIAELKAVEEYLDKNTELTPEEISQYKEEVQNLIIKSENLKTAAQSIIDEAKERLNTEGAKKVADAFDAYSKSIDDYRNGRIDKETFDAISAKLIADVSSLDLGLNQDSINNLIAEARQIVDAAKKLQEDILNSESNNKEYSDDDEKTSLNEIFPNQYLFQYSSVHESSHAKEIYFGDGGLGLDLNEEYQVFGVSKELVCSKLSQDSLKELDKHTTEFVECVTLAKTEKNYICPLKGIDIDDIQCDPYKLEPEELYYPYRNDGVYDHIAEDYSVANITNNARNQQFSRSWLGDDGKNENEESVYNDFKKLIEDKKVDNTRNAYGTIYMIDIEGTKLWNKIRTVDTLYRAKIAVQKFDKSPRLYLDGRETGTGVGQAFVKANSSKPGLIKGIETLDGKVDRQIFSDIFIQHCSEILQKNVKAEDFVVDIKDKYNSNVAKDAERRIAECIFPMVSAASGSHKNKDGESYCGKGYTISQCGKIWLDKEDQIINDALFQNLALATMNNYQAAKDYKEDVAPDETSIPKLIDGAEKTSTARDDYSSGGQIHYYETMQILEIVDADAQDLQTDILKSLKNITYNHFDKDFDKENKK